MPELVSILRLCAIDRSRERLSDEAAADCRLFVRKLSTVGVFLAWFGPSTFPHGQSAAEEHATPNGTGGDQVNAPPPSPQTPTLVSAQTAAGGESRLEQRQKEGGAQEILIHLCVSCLHAELAASPAGRTHADPRAVLPLSRIRRISVLCTIRSLLQMRSILAAACCSGGSTGFIRARRPDAPQSTALHSRV